MESLTSPAQAAAQPRFCANCGKPLDTGAAFCGHCATPVSPGAGAAPAPYQPPSYQDPAPQKPATPAWKQYMGGLAVVGALLWKFKFAIYIALRSLSLFAGR
jgi:hypothetical protein